MTVSTRLATTDDVHAIVDLMAPYNGPGKPLSGSWTLETVGGWLQSGMPVMLAVEDDNIVGVLFSAEKSSAEVPPVVAMLKAYPGEENAYVYGPVCIDASMSGRGVLGILFDALDTQMQQRQGILFIKETNGPSLGAHRKLKMETVTHFELNGEDYAVLTTEGARSRARTSS